MYVAYPNLVFMTMTFYLYTGWSKKAHFFVRLNFIRIKFIKY